MNQIGDGNEGLEFKKYELEKRRVEIEERKIFEARLTAILTALTIVIPLVVAIVTLYWQAKTEWELKAAEFVLNSKSTKAGEERVTTLAKLFPRRVDERFVQTFRDNAIKLPGLAYQEKKLELFKAMAANPEKSKDIFRIYAMIYADEDIVLTEFVDKWSKAYPEDKTWVDDFSHRWKQAYPKGRWEESPEGRNKSVALGSNRSK